MPERRARTPVQNRRQLCDHRLRIRAGRKHQISVISGRKPILLLLLTLPVRDGGIRHDCVSHKVGIGWQVPQDAGDFQCNRLAQARGDIGSTAVRLRNGDGLSDRIHVAEKLPSRVLRQDKGFGLRESRCRIPRYQGQRDDLEKIRVDDIHALQELPVAHNQRHSFGV